MRFDLLSRNAIILADEIIKNDRLVKLINNNAVNPISQRNTINPSSLIMDKVLLMPYTGKVPQIQRTELRIFFPSGNLKNRVVLDTKVVFQVVMHKDLWTIVDEDNETKMLRPYEIMSEIVDIFEDKTISTLGVIHFKNYFYQGLDKDYGLYNLEAIMTTL